MTITRLLELVKSSEIVLPAIQRDFVWDEEKIEKLLDSAMRGYPIGIILLWETYDDVQHRHFSLDYKAGSHFTFHDNSKHSRLKLVLDGQQRLQSLYVALYGTYEDRYCFFDILSGRESEDFREDKYIFRFLAVEQAKRMNEKAVHDSSTKENMGSDDYGAHYYCRLQELLTMGPKEIQQFQRDIGKKLALSEDDQLRLSLNFTTLNNALFTDPSIVRDSVLDENKPRNSEDRKSESDVLEAFVRINTQGTVLSRSDLIFSMLKLNWKESARTLPEFVDDVNKGNSFEIDSDFVIRCLFAVSNLGTRFDLDLLRKKTNIDLIRNNFDECCNSINSTVDFVQTECWIASSQLLGGYYNLVPFVYYLFHTKGHQVPNSEVDKVRKAVYLFGFSSPFSRYADSRLGALIRDELRPLADEHSEEFPLGKCAESAAYWEDFDDFGPRLFRHNPSLALHLVQRRSGAKVHYEKNAPQIDHIFPQSVLRKRGWSESKINHFANFWILAKNKNQNKNAKDPKEYFKDVSDSSLKAAYIDRRLLDYGKFRAFLREREKKIDNHVIKELDISENDFAT